MKYFKYVVFAMISIAIDLSCKLFLNFIVALFSDDNGNLPKYLKWFQTFDATLNEGVYARRNELKSGSGENTWSSFNPDPQSKFEWYVQRVKWLFRNSSYGFDYYLLGLDWKQTDWKVNQFINTDKLVLFKASSDKGFNIYYHGRFGMYKIGWKAWNMFDQTTGELSRTWGDAGKIPVVFSPNPFKRRG